MLVDWGKIEDAWVDAVLDAVAATAADNPSQEIYAGAFWLLYGDQASVRVPAFGLNSEASSADVRWHPPDWRWPVIDSVQERLEPLYAPLQEFDLSLEAYEALWEQNIEALASAARRITETAHSGVGLYPNDTLTPNFFVGIIDFSQDAADDYLRRSVDSKRLKLAGILDEK